MYSDFRAIMNKYGTKGNKYKLIQHHCHYYLRKFSFINQVIPVWNSLPKYVVSANTINTH